MNEAPASCPPLDGSAVANLCGNRASRLVENSYRQARHRTSPSDWRTGCPPAPLPNRRAGDCPPYLYSQDGCAPQESDARQREQLPKRKAKQQAGQNHKHNADSFETKALSDRRN